MATVKAKQQAFLSRPYRHCVDYDFAKNEKEEKIMSVNKVILVGRLGREPELKKTNTGVSVAEFSIATNETYMKEGQKQEHTEWHNVTLWGKVADFAAEYLHKGDQVYIEGKNKTDSWEDKETGKKMYKTKVQAQKLEALSHGNLERTVRENIDKGTTWVKPAHDGIPF